MNAELSPFAGIAAAANAGVTFDESSLTITDPDLDYDIYETLLVSAGRVKRSMSWWIGDLINFGEGLYPDRYSQAMEATGLRYETISNYAWVCRRVARSRRRDQLSFGVHAEVAALPAKEQTHWLSQAAKNRWTTSETRDALKSARDGESEPKPTSPPASPLSPLAITTAAGALADVSDTLDRLGSGDMIPADAIPRAVQAIQRATETLRVAATIPTLREAAERVLGAATVNGNGASTVPTATLDELRSALAGEETP